MDTFLDGIRALAATHPFLAACLFIVARASAIIIPPIYGLPIDLFGVAAFGWKLGFLYAEIGIMAGALTAFILGRRLRDAIPWYFLVSVEGIRSWEKRLPPKRRFWWFLFLRLTTNPLFDILSYAAGLTNMRMSEFAIATFIGNVPSVFAVFYFGDLAVRVLPTIILGGILVLLTVSLVLLVLKAKRPPSGGGVKGSRK